MAEYELSSGTFGVGPARLAREIGREEVRAGGLEAGISGSGSAGGVNSVLYAPFSPPARRWGSYRALGGPLSPRSGGGGGGARFFFDPGCEDEPRHFLDSCSLCKKPLGRNRDIYMYRGDMPFCTEECRQEQIDIDEAREKNWSLSMKASTSRKEQQKQKGKASQDIQVRAAGTVVAG